MVYIIIEFREYVVDQRRESKWIKRNESSLTRHSYSVFKSSDVIREIHIQLRIIGYVEYYQHSGDGLLLN